MKTIRHKKIKTYQPIYLRKPVQKAALVLLLFGIIAYLLLFSSAFSIKYLSIEGNEVIDTEELEEFIFETIDEQFVGSLIWPINYLTKKIENSFPYVAEAKVIRRWPDRIMVSLIERNHRFCFLTSQNNSLLLDDNLVGLDNIAQPCPLNLIKISVSGNKQLNLFSEINDVKSDIIDIVNLLSEFPEFEIMEINVISSQIKLIMASLTSDGLPWMIKFNTNFDLQKQSKHLKLFLENKSIDEISLIDYIDLGSHPERIFYANR